MFFCLQEEAYLSRVKELDEVTSSRDQKRKEHEDMRKQRLDEFMTGFSVITTKLKEMYQVNFVLFSLNVSFINVMIQD